MIYFVAENYRQACYWAREAGLHPRRDWNYVPHHSALYGVPHGARYALVGRWMHHPDIFEILDRFEVAQMVRWEGTP